MKARGAVVVGANAGFVGFISDVSYSSVNFHDPHPSFNIVGIDNVSFATPEPSTVLLLGTGLAGLAAYRRRREA